MIVAIGLYIFMASQSNGLLVLGGIDNFQMISSMYKISRYDGI